MTTNETWNRYLAARSMALRGCAGADCAAASIARAEARLQSYFALAPEAARLQARRSYLHAGDAAFHDQLLAAGLVDVLREAVESTVAADIALCDPAGRGALVISLHYGPATAILPLWLAAARRNGSPPGVAAIENSRRNPNVMLPQGRVAELSRCGFPIANLDIAVEGELAVLRAALKILRDGGTVLIFADGQLPQADAKRTLACRLGRGALKLPHGPQWLAQMAGVPLVPLLLAPQADSHRVEALPPYPSSQAQAAVQALLDRAMALDPAPWLRWCASADHL